MEFPLKLQVGCSDSCLPWAPLSARMGNLLTVFSSILLVLREALKTKADYNWNFSVSWCLNYLYPNLSDTNEMFAKLPVLFHFDGFWKHWINLWWVNDLAVDLLLPSGNKRMIRSTIKLRRHIFGRCLNVKLI